MKIFFVLLFFIAYGHELFSQSISPVFDQFNLESGLSSNEITCINQDDDGFLWIGTSEGLNRYDGNSFTQYFKSNDSNSIADNYIYDLYPLPNHRLAIATDKGLNFLNTHTGVFTTFTVHDTTQLFYLRNKFLRFCMDKKGNLWAATQTDVLIFNPQLQLIHFISSGYTAVDINRKLIQAVGQINSLPDGKILIAQKDGFFIYNPDTFQPIKLADHPESPWSFMAKKDFPNLYYFDSRSRLWFVRSGVDSVFSYLPQTNSFAGYPLFRDAFHYFNQDTRFFSFDENTLYLDLTDTGFFQLTQNSFQIKHIANLKSGRSHFFRDRQNNLWIGNENGLYEWSEYKNQFSVINLKWQGKEKSSAETASLTRIKNDIWIATYGNGLYKYSLTNGSIHQYFIQLPNTNLLSEVWNFTERNEDTLWVGTQEGLIWFATTNATYGRLRFNHPAVLDSFPITRQFTDSYGFIWIGVGVGHGVVCFNPKENSFTVYNDHSNPAFPLRHPTAIAEDENGNLWMGTQRGGGLAKWNRNENSFTLTTAHTATSFSDDRINSIFADHHGHLWIASQSVGLIEYDISQNTFETFGRQQGLSHENISELDGSLYPYLWMTTEEGLDRFNMIRHSFESFSKKDGLPTDMTAGGIYFDGIDRKMYAGFMNGMVQFDAANFLTNEILPTVFIKQIILNDQPQHSDLSQPLFFNYKQNNLTVDFTAVDLVNGSGFKFRYKMNNDGRWSDIEKNHQLHFSNLSPGDYSLFLEVANKAGLWNETPTELKFSIAPPFWKTSWFYLLVAIVIGALIYSLYRFRIRQLQHVQEMRNRIAQDLHDDIGGTMTAMNLSNELALQHLDDTPTAKKLLMSISEDLKDVGETLDDIVWTVNPKNDSMEEVMARMRRFASRTWESAGIDFDFEFETNAENIRLNMEQRHDLYLIFKEAVNNVAKHSQCIHAFSSVSLKDHSLMIEVKDDGRGFDVSTPTHRNGIKNMKSRMKKWKGSIQIDSSNGSGTEIHFQMPITQKGD